VNLDPNVLNLKSRRVLKETVEVQSGDSVSALYFDLLKSLTNFFIRTSLDIANA